MPGAGSGNLAFGKESSFKGSLQGNPDYWEFGRDPELTELSLDNQLERLRQDGNVESVESIKTQFEGAVGVSAVISTDTFTDVLDLVFNSGGTSFQSGRPNSAKIYAGVDYLGGTTERELVGCIPTDATLVNYTGDGTATFDISFLYATENKSASITPSNVTSVSAGTSAPFHAVTVDIDNTTVSKLQSAELSISGISRFQRGADPEPVDAVIAEPQTELTTEAIYEGASRLEIALGAANASSPQDSLVSVSGNVDVTVDGTTAATFDPGNLKVATEAWNNALSTDDTTESLTFNASGGITRTAP
jgi:hypothetical protein